MPLRLNHLQEKAGVNVQNVTDTLHFLVQEGCIPQDQLVSFQIELDWIQYKNNFREPVLLAETHNGHAGGAPVSELRIDTRQVEPGALYRQILRAFSRSNSQDTDRLPLEDFKSFRRSIAWDFNQLYWNHFQEWEQWTGRGYERALPGGTSDAHHAISIADGVADFWTLLRELDKTGELPPEIYYLEIGVGTGTRCGLWLDAFQALDKQRGTNYYPRLRVLLGDYALITLDQSRPAVQKHVDLCSFLVLDALQPLKTLGFLRDKILHVHTTNVYDNLPDEEYFRANGKLYLVESRAYLPLADMQRIGERCQIPVEKFRSSVERLLGSGPDYFGDHALGMTFWQDVWQAVRLEDRLVSVETMKDSPFPAGVDLPMVESVLASAPRDFRFHLSSGALQSFLQTLPLLHPRGYLQVQDIFVRDFQEYQKAFRGPGKMDGSIVNWVNGALLKGIGEQSGYDVYFAPFHYRKASHTSIMYASRRN